MVEVDSCLLAGANVRVLRKVISYLDIEEKKLRDVGSNEPADVIKRVNDENKAELEKAKKEFGECMKHYV